ncbi:MAG: hypothetical protein EXQ86_05800 [Rhodospirillales bacterium]|nr:hypothetical protein [Rhodospirillales bacterium]
MKKQQRATGTNRWAESVLLLLGHGSALDPISDRTFKRHAAALAARNLFAEVRSMTLSEAETFPAATAGLGDREVYLMPMFMSEGLSVQRAVGEAMRLLARERGSSARATRVCRPLGLSAEIASLIVARARGLAAESGSAAESLVLVGHGSPRDSASREAIALQAKAIAGRRLFQGVSMALLEEPPALGDVLQTLNGPVVVAGFFASAGRHAAEDVPRVIGTYEGGPIRYTGAIGEDAEIPEVVLRAVAEADASRSV